jgi:hydrogenase maturation protease
VKPVLILGLGNELAGDDGIGIRVARELQERRLPPDLEVRTAGPDLLHAHDAMRGRERIVLIDAVLGSEPVGTVLPLDPTDPALDRQGSSVHQLPPTAALDLLRAVDPALRDTPVTLLGVVIDRARVDDRLSPELNARLDAITDRVLALLRTGSYSLVS